MLFPQVLAGIYPIAQIQEPYTAVGYLASRIPVQALLHLRHPEAEEPSAEHPWCAWDICEGGLPSRCLPCPSYLDSALAEGTWCLDCVGMGLTGLEPGSQASLTDVFSLQLGQRNEVIKQPRQLAMMCTGQPTASCAWQWMAASACVSTLLATVDREVRPC